MILQKEVNILSGLGLTTNQAKTYFTLSKLDTATAREISNESKIAREDVYRVCSKLQKLGLVEKAMIKPAIFKAIPMEEAFSLLFNRKTKEISDLRIQSKEVLENVREKGVNVKLREKIFETVYVPKSRVLLLKTQKMLEKAQKSVYCVGSAKKISKALFDFAEVLTQAIIRGVEIKMVTEKAGSSIAKTLVEYYSGKEQKLKIKYISRPAKAHTLIVDGKETIINTSAKTGLADSSAIWSNNPCIVTLANNYFETLWKTICCREQQNKGKCTLLL